MLKAFVNPTDEDDSAKIFDSAPQPPHTVSASSQSNVEAKDSLSPSDLTNAPSSSQTRKLELEDDLVLLLHRSCLRKTVNSYLMNDSLLDVSKNIDIYEACFLLLRAFARVPDIQAYHALIFSTDDFDQNNADDEEEEDDDIERNEETDSSDGEEKNTQHKAKKLKMMEVDEDGLPEICR